MSDALAELDAAESCGCHVCLDLIGATRTGYVLCRECGCKRCPKATNHVHECTQSNASGQVGSCYGEPCVESCCATYELHRAEQRAEFDDWLAELHAGQSEQR